MAELLVQFDEPVHAEDGSAYVASAWGREDDIGRWEGWLEFAPVDGGEQVRTDRETTQPNRRDLEYWVTGLSRVYLDGALVRALGVRPQAHSEQESVGVRRPRLILDPFALYAEGEDVLRARLEDLDGEQLRNLAAAFAIASPETGSTETAGELREQIVAAARRHARRSEGEARA